MDCTLTTPNGEVVLAGSGRSGTNGLSIGLDGGSVQVAPILRAKAPKVFDRGNRLVDVSFSSQVSYADVEAAEAALMALPTLLDDQSDCTARLGDLTLYNVTATVRGKHLGATVAYDVSLRGRTTAQE